VEVNTNGPLQYRLWSLRDWLHWPSQFLVSKALQELFSNKLRSCLQMLHQASIPHGLLIKWTLCCALPHFRVTKAILKNGRIKAFHENKLPYSCLHEIPRSYPYPRRGLWPRLPWASWHKSRQSYLPGNGNRVVCRRRFRENFLRVKWCLHWG
jgi:hypothetical protein